MSRSPRDTLPPDGRPMEDQPRWRRDFPIDVAEDHYVARRDFAKFLGLTSLAFFVGQVFIALRPSRRELGAETGRKRIAAIGDVPVGGATRFEYPGPGDFCILLRLSANEYAAYDQRCTHLSCAVQPAVETGEILCPCHHGVFDAKTGDPVAGPPRRPLPRVKLAIEDGVIWATGLEVRT